MLYKDLVMTAHISLEEQVLVGDSPTFKRLVEQYDAALIELSPELVATIKPKNSPELTQEDITNTIRLILKENCLVKRVTSGYSIYTRNNGFIMYLARLDIQNRTISLAINCDATPIVLDSIASLYGLAKAIAAKDSTALPRIIGPRMLYHPKCGHSWTYKGNNAYATCPHCRGSVPVIKNMIGIEADMDAKDPVYKLREKLLKPVAPT